jgi:hypothetical protein
LDWLHGFRHLSADRQQEDVMTALAPAAFADLLQKAVSEPGTISKAYSAFHGYSIGNQVLALIQCAERGVTPGPIVVATFMGGKDKGRFAGSTRQSDSGTGRTQGSLNDSTLHALESRGD